MENSYKYFENHECRYYPCHEGLKADEPFNCLFCFCPFYLQDKCPGSPRFWDKGDHIIKDCTYCTYPHKPENYDVIMKWIAAANRKRIFSEETKAKAVPVSSKPAMKGREHKRGEQ